MKIKYSIVLICSIIVCFSSCDKNKISEEHIKKAFLLEQNLDFNLDFANLQSDISEIKNEYLLAEKIKPNIWTSGYKQEVQFYSYLYLQGKITKEMFISECEAICERFSITSSDKNMFLCYPTLQYLKDQAIGINLFKELYIEDYTYSMDSYNKDDVVNFILGIALNKIKTINFIDTIYEDYMNISEQMLITLLMQ